MIGQILRIAGTVLMGFALLVWNSPSARAADSFDVPAIVSLTGLASFIGNQDKVTLGLGEKLINESGGVKGRPIHFVYQDDQSNPQVAVQLLNQITTAKPSVIVGPNLSATCNAVAPLLANGPADYCLSPALTPEVGGYVFSTMTSTRDAMGAQIRYFRMKGWTRLALLSSTDATGQDNDRATDDALKLPENSGMQIVERTHFTPGDVSVTAQIERMKGAQPQAILVWTAGTPLGTVLKGIVQAGLDVPVAVNNANMIYAQMAQYKAFLPKQLYIAAPEWLPHDPSLRLDAKVEAAQQEFYNAFKAAGLRPDLAPVSSWDPMMIVANTLRALGPNASSAQIRDHIAHLKGYAGIDGLYDFERYPQRGLSEENVVVTEWSASADTWQVVSKPTGIPVD